jgi:acyl-CoA thioesterase
VNQAVKEAIFKAVNREPFAAALGMQLICLEAGYSCVEMDYNPGLMDNIYQRAHGGAIFSLIDEAFETVSQAYGTIAVALNINVTYVRSPEPGDRLRAEAMEISRTRRTASYDIKVTDKRNHTLIASCQALAYRTGKPIPFL